MSQDEVAQVYQPSGRSRDLVTVLITVELTTYHSWKISVSTYDGMSSMSELA